MEREFREHHTQLYASRFERAVQALARTLSASLATSLSCASLSSASGAAFFRAGRAAHQPGFAGIRAERVMCDWVMRNARARHMPGYPGQICVHGPGTGPDIEVQGDGALEIICERPGEQSPGI